MALPYFLPSCDLGEKEGGGGWCLARTWLKRADFQHAVFAVGVALLTRHLENETKKNRCLKRKINHK